MISLLYSGDENVFDGICLSLISAATHASRPIDAYVLTADLTDLNPAYRPLTDRHAALFRKALLSVSPKSRLTLLDAGPALRESLKDSPNLDTPYTPYTLLRLLAGKLPLPRRIVYVDADTMLSRDIAPLAALDLTGLELAGVPDHLGQRFIGKGYLNAGVLALNLDEIERTGLFDRALKLCLEKTMIFPDQDALNELAEKKLVLPRKYNEQHKNRPDTVLRHFTKTIRFFPLITVSNIKPWHITRVRKNLRLSVYDGIYEAFLTLRAQPDAAFLPPLADPPPLKFLERRRYTRQELSRYLRQNGGIFRKKKRQ